ncbi:MAG TPA: outer membrane beta-barrel protein [Pyrinomonadaceae bacterium]|nr:outer membrane beta-barrel protein [Pyrinomonadaceae bacterium]
MKRLLVLTLLVLCCAPASPAQSNRDDYSRFEFYAGYSFNSFDFNRGSTPVATAPDGMPMVFRRGRQHGFEVSATYNVTRYVGVKGVFTATYDTRQFVDVFPFPCGQEELTCEPLGCNGPNDTRPQCVCITAGTCPDNPVGFKRDSSLYQFLGGVQLKDNSRAARVKPFAHGLVGVARLGQTFYPNPDDPNPPLCAVCGRFTIKRTDLALDFGGGLDLRLNQRFDFRAFQVSYNPTFFGNGTQHNMRVGAGLAFR